jgi:hypothetical protein
MKTIYKSLLFATVITASATLFSFIKKEKKPIASAYSINLVSTEMAGTNQVWVWTVNNPNPGNGNNGTLQNISHWDLPLCPAAETALVSAEYSLNGGNTWVSVPIEMDRDPSIRICTSVDVLKFNVGTTGTTANYYRLTFDRQFPVNPMAVSYIKTGGGLQGCNLYFYSGVGCNDLTGAPVPANN